jgi:hypothetical protein
MDKLNLEKGEITMTHPAEAHQTQFDRNLPTILKRTSCGIASFYSALKYLGYKNGSFTQFLTKYISSNSFNVPTYYASTNINGYEFKTPIIYKPVEKAEDQIEVAKLVNSLNNGDNVKIEKHNSNPQNAFNPAFTLAYGFDHRGINPFLKNSNIPLKSELHENNNLPDSLERDSVILASVRANEIGYPLYAKLPTEHISTHIVTIYDIVEIGDTKAVLFSDPAFISSQEGLQVRSLDTMKSCTEKFSLITQTKE